MSPTNEQSSSESLNAREALMTGRLNTGQRKKASPKIGQPNAATAKFKPTNYKRLEDVPRYVLPNYSQTHSHYATAGEASRDFETRFKEAKVYWTPPADDESIPTSDEERQSYVRRLLGSMQDTTRTREMNKARWDMNGSKMQREQNMALVCWKIVVSLQYPIPEQITDYM
jgi:hypothetical protein